MYKEIGKKGKFAVIIIIFLLFTGLFSLSLVQGDKPPDAGEPPSGLLAEVNQRLNTLEETVNTLQSSIGDINIALGNLDAEINSMRDGLQEQIDSVWAQLEIDRNNAWEQIDELWVRIGNIGDSLNNLGNEINELSSKIDDIYSGLDEIWPYLEILDSRITNLDIAFGNLGSSLATLGEEVDLFRTNVWNVVGDLQGHINELRSDLQSQLDNLESGLQGQINDIHSNLNGLQGQIDDVRFDIGVLFHDCNSANDQISLIWHEINDNIYPRLDSLETYIDALDVRTPQFGRITIPAASFVPVDDTQSIQNSGHKLRNLDSDWLAVAVAGVQLPENVIITEILAFFYNYVPVNDPLDDPAVLVLYQNDPNVYPEGIPGPEGFTELAIISSGLERGYDVEGASLNHRVDNWYSYYLAVTLPPLSSGLSYFSQATIYYEYIA